MSPGFAKDKLWLDGGYDRDQVEACEYHPEHRWTVVRVGDVEEHPYDPDELMCICIGCFVPRCGHTTDPTPCMAPRQHHGTHRLVRPPLSKRSEGSL
jgi:hypothetical protein